MCVCAVLRDNVCCDIFAVLRSCRCGVVGVVAVGVSMVLLFEIGTNSLFTMVLVYDGTRYAHRFDHGN